MSLKIFALKGVKFQTSNDVSQFMVFLSYLFIFHETLGAPVVRPGRVFLLAAPPSRSASLQLHPLPGRRHHFRRRHLITVKFISALCFLLNLVNYASYASFLLEFFPEMKTDKKKGYIKRNIFVSLIFYCLKPCLKNESLTFY